MAPRSLPRWTVPDGWIPLKMRGRGDGASTGAAAGASSIAIDPECNGRIPRALEVDSWAYRRFAAPVDSRARWRSRPRQRCVGYDFADVRDRRAVNRLPS